MNLTRPYSFLGPRPFREARLRSYIVNQHRRGRPLREVLADPYVLRCGGERLRDRVLHDPATIAALEADVAAAIRDCCP
jgi:hypothetical protein